MEADGEEMKIIFVFKLSDPMLAQSSIVPITVNPE